MAKSLLAALLLSLLLVGCGGSKSSSPATLSSITIIPPQAVIAPGTTLQFTAIGGFSDGSARDLAGSVTWSSSLPATATISGTGLATGVSAGASSTAVQITASSGGITGTVALTVAALQSIAVTPATQGTLVVGIPVQFSAVGTLATGDTQNLTALATWSSANPAVATVTPAGVATGASPGATQVVASFGGVPGSAPINVATLTSATLTPANPTVDAGDSQQFTATGTLTDAQGGSSTRDVSSLVTWNSASSNVASINTNGVASALSPGSSIISASFQGIQLGSSTLTVLAPTAIALAPVNTTMVAGSTQQFAATGSFADGSNRDLTNFVTWNSSVPSVAGVSNSSGTRGLVSAPSTASGITTISASLGTGVPVIGSATLVVKRLASLAITPVNPSVALGSTLQLAATGTFTDGSVQDLTNNATWSSTTPARASVSNLPGTKGVVSALTLGSTVINATVAGSTATATVTVTSTVPVTPTNRAYVTNFTGNSVSVIDTVAATVVSTILSGGSGPQGIALNPAANRAYVANNDGTLSVIDITASTVLTTINLQGGGGSYGVALLPALNRAYVSNALGRTLSVVNTATNTLVTTVTVGLSPKGVAANPGTNLVYVVNSGDGTVSVLNGNTNLVSATITGVGLGSQEIALQTAGSRAYVTNPLSNSITLLNLGTNVVITSFSVGTAHQGIALNPNSNRVYVSNSSGTVSAINTLTNSELNVSFSPVAVGPNPQGLAVRSATNQLFVVNNGNNTVSFIDTTGDADTVTASVGVGSGPTRIAVIP